MKAFFYALNSLLLKVVTHREQGTSIALFRILLATVTLLSLWLLRNDEVFRAIWYSQEHGGIVKLGSNHWLFRTLGGVSPRSVDTAYHLCSVGAALSLVGFGGSVSVLLCQQCYVALRSLNENASGGYDSLITVGLLLLAFGRPTRTLSLDCRLLRASWTTGLLVPAWPRALLVFQLLLMYTLTGIQKVGHAWTPFGGYTAMHYVLNDPTWLRADLGAAPWSLAILGRIATAVTWHWEQLSCLLLFHWYYRYGNRSSNNIVGKVFRRWDIRKPWALTGVVMHVGILALLDVGPFSLVSLAYYVCLCSPSTANHLLQRIKLYLGRATRTPA
jgi:hypothetical protein